MPGSDVGLFGRAYVDRFEAGLADFVGAPYAVAVVNQDGVVGAQFGYDEPVTVRLKYEINQPVRGCYVGIELLTSIVA